MGVCFLIVKVVLTSNKIQIIQSPLATISPPVQSAWQLKEGNWATWCSYLTKQWLAWLARRLKGMQQQVEHRLLSQTLVALPQDFSVAGRRLWSHIL